MNNLPSLISVIVPVYNVREYLPRCVESIQAQTHKNIEIILIDDGSTDGSGDICDEYARKDSRIRVIHQDNAGVSAARNTGLDAAHGDWIGFADSDDMVLPEMYEILLQTAADSGADMIFCGYAYILPDGRSTPHIFNNIAGHIAPMDALDHLVHNRYFATVTNGLFRGNLLNSGAPLRFDARISFAEDKAFLAEILIKSKGLYYLPKAFYNYFMREGSLTQSFTEKHLSSLAAKELIAERLAPVSPELSRIARFNCMDQAIWLINTSVRNKKYEFVSGLRKSARKYASEYFSAKEIKLSKKILNAGVLLFPRFTNFVWGILINRFHMESKIKKLNKR